MRAARACRRSCSTPTTTWPGSAIRGRSRRRVGTGDEAGAGLPRQHRGGGLDAAGQRRAAADVPAAARLRSAIRDRRTSSTEADRLRGGRARATGAEWPGRPEGASRARRCSSEALQRVRPQSGADGSARVHRTARRAAGRGERARRARRRSPLDAARDAERGDGERPAVRRRRAPRSTRACCSRRRRASAPGCR